MRAAAAHETMRSGDTVDFSPIGGSFTRAPPASQPWTMHVLRPLPSLFVANPDQRRASLLASTIAIAASRAGASTCAADARIVPKRRRSAAELDAREAAVHAAAVASVAQAPPPSREYREWVDDDDTVVAKKRKWNGCASERAGKIKRSRFSDVGCKLVDLIECGMVQEGCTISFLYEKQTFQSKLLKKGKVKWQKQIYNLLGKWVLDCKRTLNPKIKKTDLPSTLAATIVGRSTPVRLAELKERYLIEQGAMEYSGGDAGAAGGGSGDGVGSRSGYGATDGGANDEHQRNDQHGDPPEKDFEVESNPMVRAVIRAKLAPNDTALPVTVGSCLDALTTVLRQSTTHDVRCKMSFLCHFLIFVCIRISLTSSHSSFLPSPGRLANPHCAARADHRRLGLGAANSATRIDRLRCSTSSYHRCRRSAAPSWRRCLGRRAGEPAVASAACAVCAAR